MALLLINNTQNQLNYVNNQVIIPANNSILLSSGLAPYLALDGNFLNDINKNPSNVTLSDGVNLYTGSSAQQFINIWLNNGPPQNSNDPIAFTLAGMGFSVTADATLTSSTETPLLLLNNPSSSGVNARAMFFLASPESSSGIVTVRAYSNPTITSNGTALSIQNNLVNGNSPFSLMNLYASPSISNNGTKRISLVSVANANTDMLNFAQTAILTPNNSLLITVSVSNLGLLSSALTHFYMQWVEA